ncbi:serine hydrolase [Pseudoalteromonas sp. MMG013]|uniref:serine hydrolase n=1 Tax=Pseudoalteromonas sp. MMG013 TaxID=2822687 RepID=UPI001B365BA7|nr:serine hydrolase [Pseudoalteromonas sp. MMG013]MBQ4862724.1 serine hydrolase [Pseudoalteromonas sp. MMG013]
MFEKTRFIGILLTTQLLLAGCNSHNDNKDQDPLLGIWNKTAYGEVLEITKDKISRFEYNQHGCMNTHSFIRGTALPTEIDQLKRHSNNELHVAYQGELVISRFDKVTGLPTSCLTPIDTTNDISAVQTFDYFWHTFNDYYAFFELRNVNWQTQYETFRPRVTNTMSKEALFEVLAAMIAPLKDGHVSLSSDFSAFSVGKPSPLFDAIQGLANSALRHGEQPNEQAVTHYILSTYENTLTQYISPSSLNTFPTGDTLKTFIWGKTADNVGILTINNMANFHTHPQATSTENMAALERHLDKIMLDLAETEALILDIRINTGGSDDLALTIAQRFATQDILAFNKQAINKTGLGSPYRSLVKQHNTPYNKPIYLLTSQITASAAEVFAMAMLQFPHVTQVGEETSGEFSDILSFNLPNGWEVGLSNEVYRNAQGENFEQVGLQPNIDVSAFSSFELESNRFESYDHVLSLLNKQSYLPISVTTFEEQVNRIMSEHNLPGLSAAVIHNGSTVFAGGFGVKDLQHSPVSADTPFFLASVTKTLVGATLAQAVHNKQILLDEAVAPLLPFPLFIPEEQAEQISLRHLITHTSGIIDNPQVYNCTYYVLDNYVSLYNLMTQSSNCVNQVNPSLPNLFEQYLTRSGELNSPQNFIHQYNLSVGEVQVYSNIATSLAAYALEKKTNESFTELSHRYVFSPLNMQDTSWGLAIPSNDVAQRLYIDPETMQPMQFPNYRTITYADGSVISTVNDLTKFLKATMNQGVLNNKQVLPAKVVEDMLSSQTDVPTSSRDIGYFWNLDGAIIHHDGADPGVLTYLIGDTHTQNGIVLLSNGDFNSDSHSEALSQIKALALRLAYTYQK